jgi:agmatine deiminase
MTLPPPPEWARHAAVWIGFPSHPELWADDLEPARAEVAAFARAVWAGGKGEAVLLVAADAEAAEAASAAAPFASVVVETFGDIWLRDTGPIVGGDAAARLFRFNGWGGKYDLPGDDSVGERLATGRGLPVARHDWVLEGGALDGDGTGTVVTTEQCLLNPNRNGLMARGEIEARLAADLGYTSVVWLGEGLLNDHTDGHVDNLARFVAPGVLAVPEAAENDPNW